MTGGPSHLPVVGHARGRSPFGPLAPSLLVAVAYALATLVWSFAGPALPGGRWLAVHLFTLGVLTTLVLAFSEHFSRTLTRASTDLAGARPGRWLVVAQTGVLAVLVGRATQQRVLLAIGATVLTVVVIAAATRLRRMRRGAVGARFTWIVRVYERAHGQFVHAAVLGLLLGVGVLPGEWYGGVRLAHLHANVLGWGGLTLLATLVFFGPTMARTRIEAGADDRAARALRRGASGLSIAVLALLPVGLPGAPGTAARLVAAAGLLVLAVATTVVCLPVLRAVAAGRRTASRPLVIGVCVWLPTVVWADVAVVAAGAWRWLDALGAAALAGVLAQAMLATLLFLAPQLLGRTAAARERIVDRLQRASTRRAWLLNLAVATIVVGTVAAVPGTAGAWVVLAAVVLVSLARAAWPVPSSTPPALR